MKLNDIRKSLYREINTRPNIEYFEETKNRIMELCAFDKPKDIVQILLDPRDEYIDVKASLLKIMLVEYQNQPHSLWSSLLILCFYPWLFRCYKRAMENTELDPDEIRMLVIESFLESASKMKVNERSICILTLLMNTERRVVKYISAENERDDIELPIEDIEEQGDLENARTPEKDLILRQCNLEDEQLKRLSGKRDLETLSLIFSFAMNNESISDYVERKFKPKNSREKQKHYNRIYTRLARLKKKIDPGCQKTVLTETLL